MLPKSAFETYTLGRENSRLISVWVWVNVWCWNCLISLFILEGEFPIRNLFSGERFWKRYLFKKENCIYLVENCQLCTVKGQKRAALLATKFCKNVAHNPQFIFFCWRFSMSCFGTPVKVAYFLLWVPQPFSGSLRTCWKTEEQGVQLKSDYPACRIQILQTESRCQRQTRVLRSIWQMYLGL